MGTMAMMAASVAASGLKMLNENAAAKKQQQAANETAARQVEELKRQQKREDEIAAEEKSDAFKEYEIELGTLRAAAADSGVTTAAAAAAAGAAAGGLGLTVRRIESNRQETQSARRAETISIISENQAQQSQTKSGIVSNTLGFFGDAAGTAAKYKKAQVPPKTPKANTVGYTSLDARAGMKRTSKRSNIWT